MSQFSLVYETSQKISLINDVTFDLSVLPRTTAILLNASSLHWSFPLLILVIFKQWSITVNLELSISDVIVSQKSFNRD